MTRANKVTKGKAAVFAILLAVVFAAAMWFVPLKARAAVDDPHPDAGLFTVTGGTADITEDAAGKPKITLTPSSSGGTVTVEYERYLSARKWMNGGNSIFDFKINVQDDDWRNRTFDFATVSMTDSADLSQQLAVGLKKDADDTYLSFVGGFSDEGMHEGIYDQIFDSLDRAYIGYYPGLNYSSTRGQLTTNSTASNLGVRYDNTSAGRPLTITATAWPVVQLSDAAVISNYANGNASITEIPELFTSGWFKVRFKFYNVVGSAAFTVNSIGSDVWPAPSVTQGAVFSASRQETLVRAGVPLSEFAANPLLDVKLESSIGNADDGQFFGIIVRDSAAPTQELLIQAGHRWIGDMRDAMGYSLSKEAALTTANGTAHGIRPVGMDWYVGGILPTNWGPHFHPLSGVAGQWFTAGTGNFKFGLQKTASDLKVGAFASGSGVDGYADSLTNADFLSASINALTTGDGGTLLDPGFVSTESAKYTDAYVKGLFSSGSVDVYVLAHTALNVKVFQCGSQFYDSAYDPNPTAVISAPGSISVLGGFTYPVASLAAAALVSTADNQDEIPSAAVEAYDDEDVLLGTSANADSVAFAEDAYLKFTYPGAAAITAGITLDSLSVSLPGAKTIGAGVAGTVETALSGFLTDLSAEGLSMSGFGVWTTGGSPSLVTGDISAAIHAPGSYTVKYSLTDSLGGVSAEKTFALTVNDTVAPVITLNPAKKYGFIAGFEYTLSGLAAKLGVAAHDAVDGECLVTVEAYNASDVKYNVTSIIFKVTDKLKFTASDLSDNGASEWAAVELFALAAELPDVAEINQGQSLSDSVELNTELAHLEMDIFMYGLDFDIEVYFGSDFITDDPDFVFAAAGTYTVCIMLTEEFGGVYDFTGFLTVNDITPPTISVGNYDEGVINEVVDLLIPTLTDDTDGAITAYTVTVKNSGGTDITASVYNAATKKLTFTAPGTYTVIYAAADAAGNPASVSRTIVIHLGPDTEPPVITVSGDYAEAVAGTAVDLLIPTITDDRDGAITVYIVTVKNSGGTDVTASVYDAAAKKLTFAEAGTYTVIYAAKDAADHESTLEKTVMVKTAPADTLPPDDATQPPTGKSCKSAAGSLPASLGLLLLGLVVFKKRG